MPEAGVADHLEAQLNAAFPRIIAKLGYAGLFVKVHSVHRLPKKMFDTASFPALKLKIGYADIGTPAHKALVDGRAASVVEMDISFNEPLSAIMILTMPGGQELSAYSLIDLIAEKFRAVFQQVHRHRNRRQD